MIKVAILGAESTGKTELAATLCEQLNAGGLRTVLVAETLREWCDQQGRTPRAEEQLGIARQQALRIDAAAACDLLLADTTAMMVAVYSELLFGDRSIHDFALQRQRGFDLTLITGLDLPWVADGIQRDGPHVRAGVDALLRSTLQQAGIAFSTVYGSGAQRAANAMRVIDQASALRPGRGRPREPAAGAGGTGSNPDQGRAAPAGASPWRWSCDKCGDPDCELRLFTDLAQRGSLRG